MNKKATVSGSFRKHLEEIFKAIKELEENGIEVLSPKVSVVQNTISDFVVLKSDGKKTPMEIEYEHLRAIARSDFLYVVNVGGYIGNSCAMEIGYALANNVPVLTLEPPVDRVFSMSTITMPLYSLIQDVLIDETMLSSFQKDVKKFVAEKGFDDETIQDILLLLVEEIGELATAIRKYIGLKVETVSDTKNIGEELADCLIYLLDIANLVGIDLDEAFINKMNINRGRIWVYNGSNQNKQ